MKIAHYWYARVNAAQNCLILICNSMFMLVSHLIFTLVIGCNQMCLCMLLVLETEYFA
jgi:hypothetical protein